MDCQTGTVRKLRYILYMDCQRQVLLGSLGTVHGLSVLLRSSGTWTVSTVRKLSTWTVRESEKDYVVQGLVSYE